MKNKLTLRNVLICCGAFLALLVFIFSFLTTLRLVDGSTTTTYQNIIWGTNKEIVVNGGTKVEQTLDPAYPAAVLPFIGVLMVILGGIGAVVVALVVKDEKIRKIALLACAGLIVVGGVFHFFTYSSFADAVARYYNDHKISSALPDRTGQYYLDAWKDSQPSVAMAVISGILAILGGGAVCVSQFVKDKKLGK